MKCMYGKHDYKGTTYMFNGVHGCKNCANRYFKSLLNRGSI